MAGSLAAAKKFTLVLKNCPDTVTGATVRFDGAQVSGDNSVLALTAGSTTAKGVGVQISDDQNKVVPLYEDSSVYPLVSTADNKLSFSARYISLTDAVTVGDANAVTQFTVVYQ
ncbi:fimbrial protein [Klebsiella michiganensis]|nr:fimbrial protein [Klebsiella michiganensis]